MKFHHSQRSSLRWPPQCVGYVHPEEARRLQISAVAEQCFSYHDIIANTSPSCYLYLLTPPNAQIFQRLDTVERKQIEYKADADKNFEKVFNAIESKDIRPKQGIFFNGQIFDAYRFVSDLFRTAKKSIIIIDNYIDDTVLAHLTKRHENVTVTILTKSISKHLVLDVKKFNEQYPAIEIKEFNNAHDRFIIIDRNTVYHFGASLKDLGKKWFAFSKMDIGAVEMLGRLDK